jgi:hypothetical protein
MDMDDFINNEMGAIASKPTGGASKPSFGAKKPSMGMGAKAMPSDLGGSSAAKPTFGKPSFAKKPGMGGPRRNDVDDLLAEEADILSGSKPSRA